MVITNNSNVLFDIDQIFDESHLCSQNIEYRGEGNSSLVVALRKEKKVLRLLKADAKQLKCSSGDIRSLLADQIAYNKNVMQVLFGKSLVDVPVLVQLRKDQVECINKIVGNQRPSFRLHKVVTEENTYALVLPDYCCLPKELNDSSHFGSVFTIEIKPKQGFLPCDHILPNELKIKSLIARYCLHQYQKISRGSIKDLSVYCPLDLFSGCKPRMISAIKNLLASPQNNLRIFKDAQCSYSEEKRSHLPTLLSDFISSKDASFCQDILASLLIRVLTMQFDNDRIFDSYDEKHEPEFCSLHNNGNEKKCICSDDRHCLPRNCVLGLILFVQKLDTLDASVIDSYNYLNEQDPQLLQNLKLSHIAGNYLCIKQRKAESINDYHLKKIWQYLVSLTAKDCSIMVTLQRTNLQIGKNVIYDKLTGHNYVFAVAITDVDQKLPEKINRIVHNDLRIVKYYKEKFL